MKPIRIILAGVVGGILMFVWGAVSHMVLPIGEMGIKPLPAEAVVLPAIKLGVSEGGMYAFPGMEGGKHPAPEEEAAWQEKYKAGPRGVLVYEPTGAEVMSPTQLGAEFATNVAAALLAAIVLVSVRASVVGRTVLATLIGVVGWLSISTSYTIWYMFPRDFAMGELIGQVAGWFISGFGIAVVLGKAGTKA